MHPPWGGRARGRAAHDSIFEVESVVKRLFLFLTVVVLAACQKLPSDDLATALSEAEINTDPAILSPYGVGLKGSGGGVVTVDGRILKIKTKHFRDEYFYAAVTPSVLGQSIEPLRLDMHGNWRIFLPDLRPINASLRGFTRPDDISRSIEALRLLNNERALCHSRLTAIASFLTEPEYEASFVSSVKYSPKADALAFTGKCLQLAQESAL